MFESKKKDKLRITAWLESQIKDKSKYGVVSNHQWLLNEQKRFDEKTIIKSKSKTIKNKANPQGITIKYEALFRVHTKDVPLKVCC